MKPEDQIKAIAELDGPKFVGLVKRGLWWRPNSGGYTSCECEAGRYTLEEAKKRESVHREPDDVTIREFSPKPYLTSRDAIVPVIEQQEEWIRRKVLGEIYWKWGGANEESPRRQLESDMHLALMCKPSQLCEALLRATGKWIP